jgi:hypothetical protein
VKLLTQYEKAREKPSFNAYIMEKKLDEIDRCIAEFPKCDEKEAVILWVAHERESVEKSKEEFRFAFGKELNTLLEAEGLSIKGQYPVLRIGLFTLKVNFQFGLAELYFGPEIEKLKGRLPLQPQQIFNELKKRNKEIHAFNSSPENLHDGLRKAYTRKIKDTGMTYGDKLLITEVLAEFVMSQQPKTFWADPQRSRFREYPRPKLSYMLYYLKKNGMCEKGMHFHVATFDATVDRIHSIWIPDNEEGEGTHCSHISFDDRSD